MVVTRRRDPVLTTLAGDCESLVAEESSKYRIVHGEDSPLDLVVMGDVPMDSFECASLMLWPGMRRGT